MSGPPVVVTACLAAACLAGAVLAWPGARWRLGVVPSSPKTPRTIRRRVARGLADWVQGRRRAADAAIPSAALPALLETLAAGLEAGLPTAAAVESTARALAADVDPATTELLSALVAAASRGEGLSDVWRLAADLQPDLVLVAQAWDISERSGAPLAEGLRAASDVVRGRLARSRQLAVLTAGPRATMRLLTLLPLLGPLAVSLLGAGDWAGAGSRAMPSGAVGAAMVAGLMLVILGRAWARRMSRAAVREPVG